MLKLSNHFRPPVPRAFLRDDSAGVAILFALSCTVLLAMAGIAIDLLRAQAARSALQFAADAAALAAANKSVLTGDNSFLDDADAYLKANTQGIGLEAPPRVSIRRTESGQGTEITLHASIATTLTRIIGVTRISLSVSATADQGLKYDDVYAVVDMSASMGLAADKDARKALERLTEPYIDGGCVFACHFAEGWEPDGKSLYQIARENKISLREDVLVAAFSSFAAKFLHPSHRDVRTRRRKMSTFGFSETAELLQEPTTSVADLESSLRKFPDALRTDTFFSNLATIALRIGPQGNGTMEAPRKTILLVTDGMSWDRNDPDSYVNGPIDLAVCDYLKLRDYKVAILDVKYQEAKGNLHFDVHIAKHFRKISPALEDCATPGLYFVADDSDSAKLDAAFEKLASALEKQLALTK